MMPTAAMTDSVKPSRLINSSRAAIEAVDFLGERTLRGMDRLP
jgi:hypothetical protein